MKRLALVVVPLLMLLAACGGGSPTAGASGSTGPTGPTGSTGSTAADPSAGAATPVVQPCDAIDLAPVEKILGQGLTKNTGTASAPSCALIPTVTGGAVFQLNYQWWFKGGLAQAWKQMKGITGTVTTVAVPDADDARLVTQTTAKAALVTGFVEDGSLIQVVNGEALPKNAARLKRAMLLLLAQISRGAPPAATSSPSPSASS